MNLNRFIGKLFSAWWIVRSKVRPSFSQAGEDQVIQYLFQQLRIDKPTYLDIGTNHPVIGNNTYYFYARGSRGVCIEPDPSFYKLIRKQRPGDLLIEAGVNIGSEKQAELYIFPHPYSGWNTFLKDEAEKREKETGIKISKVVSIPLVHINDVMRENFNPHPNLVSIDVEGLDLDILRSIDFEHFKPEVICIESITFSMNNEEMKITGIADFLYSKNYFLFADTHINSIFCRKDSYKRTQG